jgi:hypothetical protein
MEPDLHTDPSLRNILDELISLEPLFHRPEKTSTLQDFEKMMAPSFWEIGASGRRYGRDYVLKVLEERLSRQDKDDWITSDYHCSRIAGDHYLLAYTLRQRDRITRRTSIWRRDKSNWQIVFHQGTIVESS